MSFKNNNKHLDSGRAYAQQIDDEQPKESSRVRFTKDNLKPTPSPEDEDDQRFKTYNTDFITYKTIRSETTQENWATVVKIVSVILIIYSVIFFVIDFFGLIYALFIQENGNKYEFTDHETLVFMGMSDGALKAISLISDILIFIQGYYGLITVAKNSRDAINQLIMITVAFSATHIVLIIIKLIVSASYVGHYNWRNIESDMSEEEVEKMETFVYGLIIATFFLS